MTSPAAARTAALVLAVSLVFSGCVAPGTPPSPRPGDEPVSRGAAAAMAAGPGFLVHGLGHFYAGDPDTGRSLLLIEGASIGLAGAAAAAFAFGSDETIAIDGEDPTATIIGCLLAGAAAAGFLGSWIYDVYGAPGAADAWNEALERLPPPPAAPEGLPEPTIRGKTAGQAGAEGARHGR